MAGVKISALPAVPSAQLTDVFPAVQGGVTYKETNSQLLTLFNTTLLGDFTFTGDTISTATLNTNFNISPNGTGSLLVGSSTPISISSVLTNPLILQIAKNNTGSAILVSDYVDDVQASSLSFVKSRSTTINSYVPVQNNDVLGSIVFYGDDGTQLTDATLIQSKVAGAVSNGIVPSSLAFATMDSSGTLQVGMSMAPTRIITLTQPLNLNSNQINNVSDPTSAQDAATKNYVDNIAVDGGAPVVAASTTALTVTYSNGASGVGATLTNAGAQATFSLDGQSPTVGQRVLIKNQASTFENGAYTVTNVGSGATNWVLTRATDYDSVDNINDTGVIPVLNGTVNANTGWLNTTTMVTVGTTAITYVQFGASFPVSLANGGTNASLTASNGGIFYSTSSAGAILSGTATAQQLLLSGASTTPQWSTTTYPLTNAINTIMYASSANVQGVVTPTNNGVLVYSAGGVPSSSTTLPSGLAATNMNLTTPTLGVAAATSINFGGSALNNYAELQSFTPTLTFATPGDVSVVYTVRVGTYSRIGNIVVAVFAVTCTPTYATSAGNVLIDGLPFAVNASSPALTFGPADVSSAWPAGGTSMRCAGINNTTTMQFNSSGSASTGGAFTVTQITSGAAVTLRGTLIYLA